MTPTVQGETLVYQQDGREQVLTVGSAAWFAWLGTASTFSFVSETGGFTARRELSAEEVAAIDALDQGEGERIGPHPDTFAWIP